ncbi:hypothetical protein [Streptomyces sp. NL15-2K]|uniref:hypothetical protein n=1 Tax=Streptomyces sp. NL15-2K TaxID=376149 RepID=UPI000F58726D|nr:MULTISPECIES: hypothetical protein [Actinomycetes]WKX13573.1 hypothetical protein Q4V64_41020 [Kutzneria buriramensis]GCB45033.1 hypothetical protein SNL152K_2323 [Streptomyces sp. NL15-2K]
MNRTPRSIEEALRRSRVFQGEYTCADLAAARHNLARDLHELRWVRFLHTAAQGGRRAHPLPAALHEQAAHDLRVLCRGTVHHHGAARRITAFDTARDPDGALTFACLLYLADQAEGAQFWWQYTAGAGSVTAALCLYLLHLCHGDMRDAQHWADQIHRLNSLNWNSYTPVTHHADTATGRSDGTGVHYSLPAPPPAVSERAVKEVLDELEAPHDGGLGPVPQPIPALADHWEDLVTA